MKHEPIKTSSIDILLDRIDVILGNKTSYLKISESDELKIIEENRFLELKSDISQLVLTYTSLKLESINKSHDEQIEYLNKAWKKEVENLELLIRKIENEKNTITSKD